MPKLSPSQYDKVISAFEAKGLSKADAESAMKAQGYEAPGFGMKALDYGMRALDYTSGLGRGVVGGVIQAAGGPDLGVSFLDTIKGKTPPTAEMLDKMGVPQGGELSDAVPGMYSDTGDEWLKFKKGGFLDPSPRGVAGFVGDVALDPLTYLTGGASAAGKLGKAKPLLTPVSSTLEGAGRSIYKSGLKKIDQEALAFGKEPVSDVLLKHDIWGRSATVHEGMDTLADKLLNERNQILKQADMAGAEVSMKEAMAPTMARIQEIRASKDPALQGLADDLEKQVQQYMALDAKLPQPTVRELPVGINTVEPSIGGRYEAPFSDVGFQSVEGTLPVGVNAVSPEVGGRYVNDALNPMKMANQTPLHKPNFELPFQMTEAVPGNAHPEQYFQAPAQAVFDTTERVYGPGAQQATGFKTSMGVNRGAYKDMPSYSASVSAEKEMQRGMKNAVENAVGDVSGAEAKATLATKNDELGRILTTKERQAQAAKLDALRDTFTQTDAITGTLAPIALVAKQGAKAANSSAVRTGSGLLLNKAGKNIPETVWRQILLEGYDGR